MAVQRKHDRLQGKTTMILPACCPRSARQKVSPRCFPGLGGGGGGGRGYK